MRVDKVYSCCCYCLQKSFVEDIQYSVIKSTLLETFTKVISLNARLLFTPSSGSSMNANLGR